MKKIKLTVGIPVFNEEKNISLLINSILRQDNSNYQIDRILIVSDGSTDNTINRIEEIKDKRIHVEKSDQRLGKARRLNQIYRSINDSDILLQLDGDVILNGVKTISYMLKPFLDNKDVSVVYGKQAPIKPKNYVEKLAYFGFYMWEDILSELGEKAERYRCYGQITAYSRSYLSRYKLPEKKYVTDDTYSFYFAKKNNKVTRFTNKAVVSFRLPNTFKDYINQMSRYISTDLEMSSIFGEKLIQQYEIINIHHKIKILVKKAFVTSPDIIFVYIIVQLYARFQSFLFTQKIEWTNITSSKSRYVL